MEVQQPARVAVLLATYNGARFIEQQVRSLAKNRTSFALHWVDDHSTDNTREIARATAQSENIELNEYHQPQHLGIPHTFFQLLECVEADIYLFCDQDDIWQPGKIDATVANLLPETASPVLCYSDTLRYHEDQPDMCRPMSVVWGKARFAAALQRPPIFGMFSPAVAIGHTQGFTRPLREMFLSHKSIARSYAWMHDIWIYDLAIATGAVRMFSTEPTVLWRQHGNSFNSGFGGPGRLGTIKKSWGRVQMFRQKVSRHAQGFILSAPTLPPSRNLDRLLELAKRVSHLDRRQPPADLVRLVNLGATPASLQARRWYYAACLCSDATAA